MKKFRRSSAAKIIASVLAAIFGALITANAAFAVILYRNNLFLSDESSIRYKIFSYLAENTINDIVNYYDCNMNYISATENDGSNIDYWQSENALYSSKYNSANSNIFFTVSDAKGETVLKSSGLEEAKDPDVLKNAEYIFNRTFIRTFYTDKDGNRFFASDNYKDSDRVTEPEVSMDNSDIDTDGENADRLIVTSFQNYAIDENNHLQAKWGHKGYIFGTDGKGADVFARCVHGGKMTMTIGAVAVVVSSIIAIIIGCISGYAGGWVDMLLMRITEIFSSIPFLPFAMILSAVLIRTSLTENQKIFIIMLILGVLSWTGLAKMIRAQILAEREKEFVTAAKAIGVRERRIAFKHILPNVMSVILVDLTLSFATCLLTESSLSYLGFGVQYPRPTWGNMLDAANDANVIKNYWWQWAFPALLLSVCTISINIIGDNLRDVLDPKSDRDK